MSAEARHHYPTNLTDAQWAVIEPLLPEPKSGAGLPGRPVVDQRRLVDAILYVVAAASGGCCRAISARGRPRTGTSTPGAKTILQLAQREGVTDSTLENPHPACLRKPEKVTQGQNHSKCTALQSSNSHNH